MNEPEPMLEPTELMDEFERALTRALRRVDAPQGFAARAMERASADDTLPANVITIRPRFAAFRLQAWMGGAIAALLVLGVFGAEQVHVRQQRERAALAQRQFETAERITDQALAQVRAQVEGAGIPLQ